MKGFLEVFLLVDVFLAGAVASTALRHALAHFRPHHHDAEKIHDNQTLHLPPAVKEKMLETAQADFRLAIKHSAEEIERELGQTTAEIQKIIEKFGHETINDELNNYRAKLDELEKQTQVGIESFNQGMAEHHENLKAKVTEQVEAEKQRLLQQIDTKLADAMVSFLLDTMQHNVDLGAQIPYLTSVLEEHKAEFASEVADDVKA